MTVVIKKRVEETLGILECNQCLLPNTFFFPFFFVRFNIRNVGKKYNLNRQKKKLPNKFSSLNSFTCDQFLFFLAKLSWFSAETLNERSP